MTQHANACVIWCHCSFLVTQHANVCVKWCHCNLLVQQQVIYKIYTKNNRVSNCCKRTPSLNLWKKHKLLLFELYMGMI